MNKEELKKIIKNSGLSDKAKADLTLLIDEKKAKAKIEFKTLTELEAKNADIVKFLESLKKQGLTFKYEIKGKDVVLYLLYQESEIKELNTLRDEKLPNIKRINSKTTFKREYLQIKNNLANKPELPIFKVFGDSFKFYTHFRINFMDRLIEHNPSLEEFKHIIDIVLKQALTMTSKEKVTELYKGSLLQFNAEIDENFRKKLFESAKKELFFRLDFKKNEFTTEDAKNTADLFEINFIKKLKSIYGSQEELLFVILKAVDKISNTKNIKQADEYLKNIFPKILEEEKNNPKALTKIKQRIESV
ncbi:hypothetical protein KO317_02225 [Candidatus Micrarchaeota archaeon]|nr:hypothetical protein [Candidatus Micrarchaeota archaeon]